MKIRILSSYSVAHLEELLQEAVDKGYTPQSELSSTHDPAGIYKVDGGGSAYFEGRTTYHVIIGKVTEHDRNAVPLRGLST